ncbi:MAG TPA: CvpA family protein, partial [Ramlibacter sp.]|nr:CvpA family protein [Ramlibacter sp.]
MGFNAVDALLGLIVLLGAASGWRAGFVLASLELLALAAGVVLAFLGYRYPAAWVEAQWPALGVWIAPLSFLATFAVAYLVLGGVTWRAARSLPRGAHVHGINRFLGIAPGAVNGLVNATVVTLLLLTLPITEGLSAMAREGVLASRLAPPAEWVEARLSPIFDPAVRRTLQAITVPPDSGRSVQLRFTVTDPKARPDLEARMLELLNAERTQRGLKPLQADPQLLPVARAHSRDMFARGYFAHVSPEGRDLGDRLRA